MAIRQQYANEELVHKLRSMLNDLPTLRTRAIKKLEYWREAAIKRLLVRQRELEKALLDKFERLEFDTQLFVEKTERKRAQQQRRWQSEPLDFLNKSEIDRISTNLRSIREELEQSKIILVGNVADQNIAEIIVSNAHIQDKPEDIPTKVDSDQNYDPSTTTNELGLELMRVLEICTSPQCSSTILSPDEQSRLQSLDHAEYAYDAESKQTTTKTSTTYEKKRSQPTDKTNRRHARIITDISNEQEQHEQGKSKQEQSKREKTKRESKKQEQPKSDQQPTESPPNETSGTKSHKSLTFESFDDSTRRTQRLREVRKNLQTKYDKQTQQDSKTDESPQSPKDSTRKRNSSKTRSHNTSNTSDQTSSSAKARDRKNRSRTLDTNQMGTGDNQVYGCTTSKSKQSSHRSDSHKNRSNRLSFRRSSEDIQDKKLQLKRHRNPGSTNPNETWFEIEKENWTNLLENGWRPTHDSPGVNLVTFADSDDNESRKCSQEDKCVEIVDLYERVTRNEYALLFEQLEFAYSRTIDLGNEFWRFLEIDGDHHLCLYHQLNKQFILYKPDTTLLCFPWPYDGIVDISWSKPTNTWAVATQTQIIICNRSFSEVLESIDISGDWPKRITSCRSSIFHTFRIPPSAISTTSTSLHNNSSNKDCPQFLLERYDYKLNSLCKHILESSTIWDIEADDLTEHLAILCDVALLIFDYQLNLLRQIEVTGFKVSKDRFGGWLIADYNASCIWQIRRNEYLKPNKILNVERPWSIILDQHAWTLVTLSETQNRAKRLLFFTMNNIPKPVLPTDSQLAQSQLSSSPCSVPESVL